MSVPRWPGASTWSPPDMTSSPCSRSRPDILRDTESRLGESMLPPASPPSTAEKTKKSLPLLLEDPVRRRYKAILTVTFIATSGLYIVVDVIFQVTTSSVSAKFYEPFRSRVRSPRATSPQHLLRTSHRWHSHILLAPQISSPFHSFSRSLQHLLHPAGGVGSRGEPGHRPLPPHLRPADHQPLHLPLLGVPHKVNRNTNLSSR